MHAITSVRLCGDESRLKPLKPGYEPMFFTISGLGGVQRSATVLLILVNIFIAKKSITEERASKHVVADTCQKRNVSDHAGEPSGSFYHTVFGVGTGVN